MRTGKLEIAVDDNVRRPRIVLTGEMDADSEEAGPYLVERMKASLHAKWQVDMSGVTFVDSSGLRALLVMRRSLGVGGSIVICDPSASVRSLLRLSRLDHFFPVVGAPSTRSRAPEGGAQVSPLRRCDRGS